MLFKELNKSLVGNGSTSTNAASNLSAVNKEKAKYWVKERATHFLNVYDKSVKEEEMSSENDQSESILVRLTKSISKLQNEVIFLKNMSLFNINLICVL